MKRSPAGSGLINRRLFMCGCCAAFAGARVVPASAAVTDVPVSAPLAKDEPHHHVIFQNDAIRIFRILIPAGGSTLWHEHNYDFGVFFISGSQLKVELPDKPEAALVTVPTGAFRSFSYFGKHLVHRVSNPDTVLSHQLAYEILVSAAGTSTASDRMAAPQYKVETDNDRVRAWRLQLQPGEMAEMIVQNAPSVRFVLAGERIVETDEQGQVSDRVVRRGDFAWMPGPATRSVTNGGSTPLEFVEIELK